MLSLKRDHYSKRLREIERRIASISAEIRSLEETVSDGARKKIPALKRPLKKDLPESERRLVSYLSTGSFQTIDLRRHERRAVKVRRAVLLAVLLLSILFIWIWFRG